eukprot:CAMPEP_0113904482 /NCGR_PEP_ID=MMETSP0780_2-20120614/23280_1 /TAXON_ID=652834 /ORGANISM="Palpitomonas bilix" /LENGTH=224 /DNA_ID=CAMNT_0000898103 /DNA_START=139 /DNA_END=814 /DNA_ORIENTATION=+ /assembly_acc=CAM_ASM_000599
MPTFKPFRFDFDLPPRPHHPTSPPLLGVGLGHYNKLEAFAEAYNKEGAKVLISLLAFVDSSAAIIVGREVYGQPRKFGQPLLSTESDTLTARFNYRVAPTQSFYLKTHSSGEVRDDAVALATMRYKEQELDTNTALEYLHTPEITVKMIPDVNGTPAIAELVKVKKTDIVLHGAWKGLARLHMIPHANAPLSDLPVREMGEGFYIKCDARVDKGEILHDYLADE